MIDLLEPRLDKVAAPLQKIENLALADHELVNIKRDHLFKRLNPLRENRDGLVVLSLKGVDVSRFFAQLPQPPMQSQLGLASPRVDLSPTVDRLAAFVEINR